MDYQFPRGKLPLIVPAPISPPVLINLCQVKPQITCQINDWVSPGFPWAFKKKRVSLTPGGLPQGIRLLWVYALLFLPL